MKAFAKHLCWKRHLEEVGLPLSDNYISFFLLNKKHAFKAI